MNLTDELNKLTEEFKARAPEAVQVEMKKAHNELMAKKITATALQENQVFPVFELKNQNNKKIKSEVYFKDNNFLVISFYRGGWCPFCNLELRALQGEQEEFYKLGATLVAITPELPDKSLSTAEKNALDFDVLSDENSVLASQVGISFELPENLKPTYKKFGIDLPEHNGYNNYTLPVPATYLIDREGKIHYSFVELDYKLRANPDEIIEKLKGLNN
jgi:peroxiredoxin